MIMKSNLTLVLAATAGLLLPSVPAADKTPEKHRHEKIQAGPTGGRLITSVEPHVEFLITKERKVELRYVDDDNKVVAPLEQVISVVLGDRAAPTRLTFTKDGDKLVSDKAVPAGNNHPTVVQIRQHPGAKPVTEKFNLNLDSCPTCKYLEYACVCDHEGADGDAAKK